MHMAIARILILAGLLVCFNGTASAQCGYTPDGKCSDEQTTGRGSVTAESRRTHTDEKGLEKFTQSLRDRRKTIKSPKDTFNYFDLNIEGICGPNGFASEADNFLAGAANYFLINEKRAVALTVTLTESGPSTTNKEQEIPLIVAKPDAGKPTVDCSRTIRSGYHRAAVVKLKFNFYVSKERYEVSSAVTKFTAFFKALLDLDSRMFKIPQAVIGTAAARVFLGDIDKITKATNELLADAFEKKSDDTVTIDISEEEGGVTIPIGTRTAMAIKKSPRDTVLFTGPTYKGGPVLAAFKNVTGQDFAQLTVNVDASDLGKSASDDARRKACGNVRKIISNFVVSDDLLLMMSQFVSSRADILAAHKGYNCLLPDEAKQLRDRIKYPEPYSGAYAQAIAQEQPQGEVARELFDVLRDRLTIFATQLKSLSLLNAVPASPEKAALLKQAKAAIMEYFSEQVSMDGAGREPLFPLSTQTFTDEEIANQLMKWPKVVNFGCFLPVPNQTGKEQKYILEGLLRAETAPKPTIFHFQIKGAAKGTSALIDQMWVTKLGTAKSRFADKFKQGCGDKSPLWFPWKEMDDWTAEERTAGLIAPANIRSAHAPMQ